ncbi:hypothetical protein LIER_33378 [Lithospermum erythrorhizon]|uniref:MULE transposase domain-containing protein n=1 Tax=Lithospermum erythrorhizon TaxID=34254 RepID=A0AAV3RZR6_LITER
MFKIKISKHCARRTKEKALKKINGDDLEQFYLVHTYCKELMNTHPGRLDSNNGWWPLAWVVVEKENAETWKWFLEGVMQDIGIVNQKEWVVISDKQNGLEQVIHDLLPEVTKRNCVQHIYQNFKKEHR